MQMCKLAFDSDWLFRRVVVAPEAPGLMHAATARTELLYTICQESLFRD